MKARLHFGTYALSIVVVSSSAVLAQNAQSWYQAAKAAIDSKNYVAAIADMQKALQYDSTYASAWFDLGYAYLYNQQFQQAATTFKKYLSLSDRPDEQGAWLMLGIAYQDLKLYDNAADAFRSLIRLTNERGMSYKAHYELGHSLCLGGKYSAAVHELEYAITLEAAACDSQGACADSEDLRTYLGLSYYRLQRYPDALQALNSAVTLKPNDTTNYYLLGMTYVRMGRRTDALTQYQKLRSANSNDANDLYAEIQKMGVGATTKSAPQPTATQSASAAAGQCQEQIDAEAYTKAVDACRVAVASAPFDASIWSNLGMAYFGSKRYDEAAQAYQQVTRSTPKDARAQYGIGAAYVETKQYEKAVPYLREAVGLDSSSGNEWYDLGHSLYETGQYASAAEALETAARLQPNDAATDYWLGRTYVKLRSKSKAQAAYQRLVGPDKNKDQKLAQQLNAEINTL